MRNCENGFNRDGIFKPCRNIARFFWMFAEDSDEPTMWVCAECYDTLVALHKGSIIEDNVFKEHSISILKLNGVTT